MVRELDIPQASSVADFPKNAPAANPVFFRTYSRRTPAGRETWGQTVGRSLGGLVELGGLTEAEESLLERMMLAVKSLPSGRWLWVGGTDWLAKPKNFSGAYNCTSTNVRDWAAFGLMMDLAMMGCGTGAVLESRYIEQLPVIRNRLQTQVTGKVGDRSADRRQDDTTVRRDFVTGHVAIQVGDSRRGWVDAYQELLELASDDRFAGTDLTVAIDLSHVRPAGEILKGFGGMANPVKLPELFPRLANVINKAQGRKLNAEECCLLVDEAAACIVAGNIRRSAGMRQFDASSPLLKDNLWQPDENGNWRIDPARDALRMANHTRVFHDRPSLEDLTEAVRKQYQSGEGAIQWAGEAVARGSADLWQENPEGRSPFIAAYARGEGSQWLQENYPQMPADEIEHRLQRYGLNPCGEIIGADFHCNLAEVHLNQLDPQNFQEQEDAFRAGAIAVAALLNHQFIEPRYQRSRELDPIVGVSFTGLFDFFVKAFGVDWLKWWKAGRPETSEGLAFKRQEQEYLQMWRKIVHEQVWAYCDRRGLKRPNRCTTVQPAGTKSLLTGASPGWHPPKAARFIRRVTFRKNDPVALACIDYGYSVVPSQSDKDENGNLLDDPFDPRCTEWLVEIPVAVSWADMPGCDEIDLSKFSVAAQFDFAMQVQRHYVTHNTSSTLELRENEIEELGVLIHQAIEKDEGYISAALLARFDDLQTFPRLPFEPISRTTYQQFMQAVAARRVTGDFHGALLKYDLGERLESGPAGCDSDKCLLPERKP